MRNACVTEFYMPNSWSRRRRLGFIDVSGGYADVLRSIMQLLDADNCCGNSADALCTCGLQPRQLFSSSLASLTALAPLGSKFNRCHGCVGDANTCQSNSFEHVMYGSRYNRKIQDNGTKKNSSFRRRDPMRKPRCHPNYLLFKLPYYFRNCRKRGGKVDFFWQKVTCKFLREQKHIVLLRFFTMLFKHLAEVD